METLMDSETLKRYEKETSEYIKEKKIDKLFDIILKNVLVNKPENIYMYIYSNIYSFLLNKIFIIGPPLLKITANLSSVIAASFNYDYISTYNLVKSYISKNEEIREEDEEENYNKVIEKVMCLNHIEHHCPNFNDVLVSALVNNAIKGVKSKEKRGYVVEGYPRNNLQAQKCIHFLPSYVIVLYADENYIYKKYEEENNIKIFSGELPNPLMIGTETDTNSQNYEKKSDSEKTKEFSPMLFEMKAIDPKPLRDKVKSYFRNITSILEVLTVLKDKKKIYNLSEMTEEELIQTVKKLVEADKDKWKGLLDQPLSP